MPPIPCMTTPTTSRARFEEWAVQEPHYLSIEINHPDSAWPGQYGSYHTELAWLAYQHAEVGKRECVEALRRLSEWADGKLLEMDREGVKRFGEADVVLAGLKENEG